MPLQIELAPNERLLIGDIALRNGTRRCRLTLETQARILRGKDILLEHDADTPAKRLYFLLEAYYLSGDSPYFEQQFTAAAESFISLFPGLAGRVADIWSDLHCHGSFRALRTCALLMADEASVLATNDAAKLNDQNADR
ncbi:MAG: hypothetical protein JJU40_16435 [Rhodobacteraceae bacterium]|nr:hypothetical protein [Paracoccaceae bacterium]